MSPAIHQLTKDQVVEWSSGHGRCPQGECADLGWSGFEAAYSCRHCMARRSDIEQQLDPCRHDTSEEAAA